MNLSDTDLAADLCYRCGYDLRATPDDRPCPECGLLAERSRRPSDELRYTRPRWLLALAWGSALISMSIFVGIAWAAWVARSSQYTWLAQLYFDDWSTLLWGWLGAAVMFFIGIFLLTRREGYIPADRADRVRRLWLRLAAGLPLLAGILGVLFTKVIIPHRVTRGVLSGGPVFVSQVPTSWITHDPIPALGWAAFFVATVGSAPLVVLLFLHLRGLARRARSAHLAEHCIIVGIGAALALLYVAGYVELRQYFHPHGSRGFMRVDESMRSPIIFNLTLALGVMAGLFILWSIYLLLRFTISFIAAARNIRGTQGKPS